MNSSAEELSCNQASQNNIRRNGASIQQPHIDLSLFWPLMALALDFEQEYLIILASIHTL